MGESQTSVGCRLEPLALLTKAWGGTRQALFPLCGELQAERPTFVTASTCPRGPMTLYHHPISLGALESRWVWPKTKGHPFPEQPRLGEVTYNAAGAGPPCGLWLPDC